MFFVLFFDTEKGYEISVMADHYEPTAKGALVSFENHRNDLPSSRYSFKRVTAQDALAKKRTFYPFEL